MVATLWTEMASGQFSQSGTCCSRPRCVMRGRSPPMPDADIEASITSAIAELFPVFYKLEVEDRDNHGSDRD